MFLRRAAAAMGTSKPRCVRGVIFDMDGTLTEPCLDFVKMRRRVCEALERDIGRADMLAEIEKEASAARREAAHAAIHEVEAEGWARLVLAPGVSDVCGLLDARGVPRAILTRNSEGSLEHFHSRLAATGFKPPLGAFQPALSRDSGFPPKPHPDALLYIARDAWGVPIADVVMIGDSAKDDVAAGRNAGAITVLLGAEAARAPADLPPNAEPDFRVADLPAFKALLEDGSLELQGLAT